MDIFTPQCTSEDARALFLPYLKDPCLQQQDGAIFSVRSFTELLHFPNN